jgi:ABC-type antimicrobial peptide transport system permease subunit
MGLKNLFRRKTRTILTILGVVIGTAAIVVMVSLGIGMNESYDQQIKQMGSLNIINVSLYKNSPDGANVQTKKVTLDDKAIEAIRQIEGVKDVTPTLESFGKLVSGKYMAYTPILGINAKSMANFDYKIAQGRLLQEGDSDTIIIGGMIPQNFFNPKVRFRTMNDKPPVNVLKDKLELTFNMDYGEKRRQNDSDQANKKPAKLYKIKGAGILATSNDYQKDGYIYMDITELKKLMKDSSDSQSQGRLSFGMGNISEDTYQQALVYVEDFRKVEEIQKQIDDMGFGTRSLSDVRKSMQKQSETLRIILGGIGAVSLLIAAIGITNTMIMSIYERTREIGVMKVLGCKMGNIRRLFLFEAGVIGLLGGIAGITLSYIASFVLNSVGGNIMGNKGVNPDMGMYMMDGMQQAAQQSTKISVIPVWLALFSILFAILIGIISGFMPARRAMKLSALEAIKTE